jgi:hypothetical protein
LPLDSPCWAVEASLRHSAALDPGAGGRSWRTRTGFSIRTASAPCAPSTNAKSARPPRADILGPDDQAQAVYEEQINGILRSTQWRAGGLKYQKNLASFRQIHKRSRYYNTVSCWEVGCRKSSNDRKVSPYFSLIASMARLRRENARRSYRSNCLSASLSSE